MSRSSFRPMASVGLVVAVLAYVGCSETPQTIDRPQVESVKPSTDIKASISPKKTDEPAKLEHSPKMFASFSSRRPSAALVISGEQDGYPSPCGCTEGQLGGLGRRHDFIEKLEAQGVPLVKVDLGNLIHYRGDSRGGLVQEKIKFNIIQKALAAMKYDAVALGPEDLKLGVVDTLVSLLNTKEPRFLAANVKASDKELGEAIKPTRFVEAGGLKIGITAVLDPSSYQTLQDADAATLTVLPPDDVLPGVLQELSQQSLVQVLMVQGPREEAKRLAEKYPKFEIVIGTSEFDDPDEKPTRLHDGKTLLINNIGKRGKYVGVVAFYPYLDQKMEFFRLPLDGKDFKETETIRLLIDKEYQDMLKLEGVVENYPRARNGQAPGSSYVGAQNCQACHPKAFEKWMTTKHAKAYEPLTNPRRNREFDAECISCHTTGFGYATGWVSAEKTPLLKGNQCENCHGPGSQHAANPDNLDFRKPMKLTAEWAETTAFCTKCHDSDNDPHFKFSSYYPQIFHKGLDDYSDPKVHQAQPAKAAVGAK